MTSASSRGRGKHGLITYFSLRGYFSRSPRFSPARHLSRPQYCSAPDGGLAAAIAPLVAIRTGIASVETALAGALMSVGRFRLLVPTGIASVAVTAAGAVVTATTGSWVAALLGLTAASLVRHLLQVVFTVRQGALDGWSLVRGYLWALVTSIVLGGATALVSAAILGGIPPITAFIGAAILVAAPVVGLAQWRRLPPTRILARYRTNDFRLS